MIVYFADRNLNVQGSASTHLPKGITILEDEKNETLETGVKTFSVTFVYDDTTRNLVVENVAVGNFLLRSADDENELYTIVSTEHSTAEQTVQAYCEDAGLNLLNWMLPAYTFTTAHDINYYMTTYLNSGWEIGVNELEGPTLALSWDGESTVLERLESIVNSFGGEMDFSYVIDRLTLVKKYINLYKHRGNSVITHQLRLGGDISSITTNTSIENIVTVFNATGGTPEGSNTPINLVGANYSSDGTTTHSPAVPTDDYQIVSGTIQCKSAMAKWSSKLDSDGYIKRPYTYDTLDKQTLFSHAVAEMRKVVDEEVTYDLEFITFPDDLRLGDRVNVVDDKNNLYLEGRILTLTKSISQNSTKATLGEWVKKTSGISDRLLALAHEIRQQVLSATSVTIASSGGLIFNNTAISTTLTATVYYGDEAITTQTRLEEVFGTGVAVNWYNNGSLVGTGFSYSVSSANTNESYIVKVED